MVAEALVREINKEQLTVEMIRAGSVLTHYLGERLPVTASFWFYLAESNSWRLFLASPQVAMQGPRKVYRQVQIALLRLQQGRPEKTTGTLDLEEITVVDDEHALVKLLRTALRGEFGNGKWFSRNTVNGQYIEDAYIYRL
jgi:hypothetical protein